MSKTVEVPVEKELPSSPYIGLTPFTEDDAAFFCGRELDSEIVAARLRASRMTLLLGPSGVGKSSLINAGVVSRLRQISRETAKLNGRPDFIIAVFRDWLGDPIEGIFNSLQAAVTEASGALAAVKIPSTRDLSQLFATTVSLTGAELLIILDQFEEYLLHQEESIEEGVFAYEFPRAIQRLDLPVKFLLSVREDSIAKLDVFKGHISGMPDLFENRLAIKHLDKKSARRAILKPVKIFNKLCKTHFTVERALVKKVLEDLEPSKIPLSEGQARLGDESGQNRVETPYLQLVMTRIWKEELKSDSKVLRLTTLTDKLGGALKIVQTYLDEVMNQLSDDERELAAKFVHFTVTRFGTKIPVDAATLTYWADLPSHKWPDVEKILSCLGGNQRIFRQVTPPRLIARNGHARPTAIFEIYHDALTPAVLSWRKKYVEERTRERLETTGRLLKELSQTSGGRAELVKAAFEQAIAIDSEIHGPDNPRVAEDASYLGLFLKDQGDLLAAKEYVEQALRINEQSYGPRDPKTAVSRNTLGLILKDLGDLKNAETEFEQALKINQDEYGSNHPEVAASLNNLGHLLKDKGEIDRALKCFQRALRINEAAYGANHPSVAINLNNLGITLKDHGDTEEARRYFERALEINEAFYGPDRPEVATNLSNLAYLMKDKGNVEGAQIYFERALEISEAYYGAKHPELTTYLNNLAYLMKEKGDAESARLYFERVLSINETAYGRDHPNVVSTLRNLDCLLQRKSESRVAVDESPQ